MADILFGDDAEENITPATSSTEQGGDVSEITSAILARAKVHQSQASGPRLHNTVRTAASISNPSTSRPDYKFQNLNKAQKVVAERKKKTEEAKLTEVGIRLAATLWILDNSSNLKKAKTPTQVTPLRVVQIVDPDCGTGLVLDQIFGAVRESFQKLSPDEVPLSWSNVTCYAHENQTKYSSLEHIDRTKSIAFTYKNEFLLKKLGPTRQLEDRFIEIRFIFTKGERNQRANDNDELESHQLQSRLSLVSKRKRLESSSVSTTYNSAALSGLTKSSAAPRYEVLKSAYRPPVRPVAAKFNWSRDVEMVICNFTRTTARYIQEGPDSGQVVMEASRKREVIEVAETSLSEEGGAGFIGNGSTKRGIYARFEGQEYVITVPIDLQMSHCDVQDILEAEFKLLCLGDSFKIAFDAHASNKGVVTIPKFYFNFKGAILGRIIPSPTSNSRPLPYLNFLATPLLPCGPVDAPVKKFTGNGSIGDADDHITRAIHAFAHFSVLYSQENLLFCDLQGALDIKGHMCLIDPQAHTSSAATGPRHYWDRGPVEIANFLKQHQPACGNNWICNALNLDNLVFEPNDDIAQSESPPKKRLAAKRGSLSFITNPDT